MHEIWIQNPLNEVRSFKKEAEMEKNWVCSGVPLLSHP